MNTFRATVPWNTQASWHQANAALCHLKRRNHAALEGGRAAARQLAADLTATFPLMNRLCRQTCSNCTDICCRRAWVWIDFKDLLFLHLAGIPRPGRQLLRRQGDHCRYAGLQGCQLKRIQRPFVCTWYLCPRQTRVLASQPSAKRWLSNQLGQIKQRRSALEDRFVRATLSNQGESSSLSRQQAIL